MFNLLQIIKQHQTTFYDYSSGRVFPAWRRYGLALVIGAVFGFLFPNLNKDFANAIITVFAILIGFSFNVLFYLLSANKMKMPSGAEELERQIKIEKLNKLANELFFNVSYFNILSIAVVVVALMYFVFDSRLPNLLKDFLGGVWLAPYGPNIKPVCLLLRSVVAFVYRLCLYFLLVESLLVFVRIVGRVTYYFQNKIALQDDR